MEGGMPLHIPINRGSRRDYCGPTAMASVTGLQLKRIREAIIQQRDFARTADGRRYKSITGLSATDLIGAMDLLGWSVVESEGNPEVNSRHLPKLMTLEEFCRHH